MLNLGYTMEAASNKRHVGESARIAQDPDLVHGMVADLSRRRSMGQLLSTPLLIHARRVFEHVVQGYRPGLERRLPSQQAAPRLESTRRRSFVRKN